MVNNTIDVARLEAGRLSLQIDEVDLVDVVGAVFAVAEPLALQQGVALSKSVDPAIPVMRTDGEALRKVLLNLVGNALKFTEPGGAVVVSAQLDPAGNRVRLTVADTGCGIALENAAHIFEKFARAVPHEGCGSTPGSGLGLYLVKNLVERLGGEVSVASVVGEGSVFTAIVPLVADGEGREDDGEDFACR